MIYKLKFKVLLIILLGLCSNDAISQNTYKSLLNSFERSWQLSTPDSAFYLSYEIRKYVSDRFKDSTDLIANSITRIGDVFYRVGNVDSALSYYNEACAFNIEKKNRYAKSQLDIYFKIGICYADIDKDDDALKAFLSVNQLFDKFPEISFEHTNELYDYIGRIYYKIQDYNKALFFAFKQLKHTKKSETEISYSYFTILQNIANIYKAQNQFQKSDSVYRVIGKSLKSLSTLDSCYYGSYLIDYAKFKNEIDKPNEAFDILKVINFKCINEDPELYCSYQLTLAMCYNSMGNFKKAVEIFENMLKNSDTYTCISKIDILSNLGVSYYSLGNVEKAESNYLLSLSIPSHSEDSATTYYNLSLLKFYDSKVRDALNYIDSAVLKTRSDLMRARLYSIKSECYYKLDLFTESIASINESITLFNKKGISNNYAYANAVAYKSWILTKFNKYDSAKLLLSRALSIYESNNLSEHVIYNEMISRMAFIHYKLNEIDSANILFARLLNHTKDKIASYFVWLTSDEKFKFWQLHQSSLQNIVNISMQFSRNNTLINRLLYDQLIITKSILLENSRSLVEAASKSQNTNIKNAIELLRNYKSTLLMNSMSENLNNSETTDLKIKTDSLEKYLVKSLGEYAISKKRLEVNWRDVQKNLNDDEASIEYARFVDAETQKYRYAALIIRKNIDNPILLIQGYESNIKSAIKEKDFSRLHTLVWNGVDSLMKGIKQVYISPIGEVNKISFSAIYQNNLSTPTEIIFSDTIKSSKNNQIADESISQKYLIDRYTIRILTTTRYLADGTLIKKKEWNKRIILMGGIDYDRISRNSNCLEGQDFTKNNTTNINNNYNIEPFNRNTEFESPMPYLSGTLEEIDRIGFRLKKENWSVTSFTDSSALEHCLKTELNTYNPCIIHIATHGFSFIDIDRKDNELNINSLSSYKTSENPMSRCGLMLSGSNLSWVKNPLIMIDKTGEDGILTASEVANLDLSQTSLVVLSACNTGIGQIEDGEGIFGLNRGFKLAGVDELIVSLWEVEDFQTMELMDKFYSLLSHNQNASLSFHQAQSWMRTKYPTRPDLWAGFVFIH